MRSLSPILPLLVPGLLLIVIAGGCTALVCGDNVRSSSLASGKFSTIAGSDLSTCGIAEQGQVLCWGKNDASPEDGFRATQVDVAGRHACGLDIEGKVACWGVERSLHWRDPPEGAFAQVSVSTAFACAIRANGELWCWSQSHEPKKIATLGDVGSLELAQQNLSMELSALRVCYLTKSGVPWCTGDDFIPLGHKLNEGQPLKKLVMANNIYCGIALDGALVCRNSQNHALVKIQNPLQEPLIDVDAYGHELFGWFKICAVGKSGSVRCWSGKAEQVAESETGDCVSPAGTYRQVVVGLSHSCGLRSNGRVVCWGFDAEGSCTPP